MYRVDCEEFLREIERFLDRELPDGECLRIEEHLSGCSPCMRHVEFRRRLQVILASKCGSERIPDGLVERLRASLDRSPER